jgi:alpha-beta hydrolase superfamily lysophospholipase
LQALTALVQAVRTLPGAHPDRVALFGHSRGAGWCPDCGGNSGAASGQSMI